MNWSRFLVILGTALTGVGTVVPGWPGVVLTIAGGALLTQANPSDLSRPTAKLARRLTPTTGVKLPDETP